jgi:Glutaredoxin-like domain (DUF836).
MILVELYSKDDCCLCDEAKAILMKVREEIPFEFREIKLNDDEHLINEYALKFLSYSSTVGWLSSIMSMNWS